MYAALVQRPRVDAEVRQVAVRIGRDLEGERRKAFVVVGPARRIAAALGIDPDDRTRLDRRRQILDDRVEQRLHAFVLECRTAEHRQHRALDRRAAQGRLHAIHRKVFAFEEHLEKLVVLLGDRFDELAAVLLGQLAQLARLDLRFRDLRAEIVGVRDLFHREEIDDALERILGADRTYRNGARAEALANLRDDVEEVGAHAVQAIR